MLHPLILPFLLALPLFFFFFKAAAARRSRSYNLPPGPRPLPVIGNLLELRHLPHISLFRLSKQYGSLIYLKLGQAPTVVASSKEAAMAILRTHDLAFCTRPVTVVGSKFSYGGLDIAFSPFNDHWKRLRKFGSAEMFSSGRVQSFRSIREEEVAVLVDTIRRDSSRGELINLSEMALCLFNNITYREVFGRRISADGECGTSPHHEMIMAVVSFLGGFNVSDFFPSFGWLDFLTGRRRRLEKRFRQMDALFETEIEERLKTAGESRGGSTPRDFLDVLLLRQVETDPLLGFLLSRDEIKALLVDMFFGATVTTAVTLVWGMTELMRNKSAMRRAQQEVRRAVGGKGKVEEDDLKHLRYLNLVIKETLRLHPAAPLLGPHECVKDSEIDGYDIPARTRVIVNFTAISRDPRWWEDPEVFRPERFENSSVNYNGNHLEFIPFGSGRRSCPGMSLGLASVEVAFANVLYAFDWSLPEGMGEEDVDMGEHFGIGVSKKDPLMLMARAAF